MNVTIDCIVSEYSPVFDILLITSLIIYFVLYCPAASEIHEHGIP